MTTQRQTTTQTVTREEIDLDAMIEEATTAMQRASAAGRDTKALSHNERVATLAALSKALGLNPLVNGVQFLSLSGREVLYVTKQATDQIAARLRLNRETIAGPEVRDFGGTKLVFCQVRVTAPDGRSEVATATLPLGDLVNAAMKVETKAKRRATLSLAGLGLLTEEEADTIPGAQKVDVRGAPLADAEPAADREDSDPRLVAFYEDLAGIELPGEAVAVWMKHRANLAMLLSADREPAWKALCARTEEVGKMKNAKVWLKKAIAEEDARRGIVSAEPEPSKRILDDVRESAASRHTVRELADLWRSARAEIKAAKADVAGWKIIADRALALGLVPGEVKAEVRRLDAPPPPDGTDGPSGPRSAANDTAGAEGSPAPVSGTHGPVALAAPDAWRLSAAGITAHVAEIGNIPRLANSARRNLGAIVEPLRTHAVHVYAGRLQALSHDGTSTLAWEACIERTETWLREGPKDAAPPQRRKDKAA